CDVRVARIREPRPGGVGADQQRIEGIADIVQTSLSDLGAPGAVGDVRQLAGRFRQFAEQGVELAREYTDLIALTERAAFNTQAPSAESIPANSQQLSGEACQATNH